MGAAASSVPSLIGSSGGDLINALTQIETNGNSLLGTLSAPTYPSFLTNNPLPNGYPWGSRTANGTNPYTNCPNTGVTRKYDFTITRGTIAPDGYEREAFLINGAYPGPTIEANWGDMVEVTVHNNIAAPAEGMSIHWHGILQTKTPWYDGVPSVQQCPIAPGSSFTYNFQADLYGTTWYHSHFTTQYVDGILGAFIIHGPKNAAYDIDLGPVFITDYFHTNASLLEERAISNGSDQNIFPTSDNNLINGKMDFNCSTVAAGDDTPCTDNAGISKFKFTKGKKHRLRLINAGAEGLQFFSIDGHSLTVIAVDLVPIKPYTTDVVTLHIGQRTDVIVTANQAKASAWWMRSNISALCSFAHQPNALAAVYYNGADMDARPNSTAHAFTDDGTCVGDDISEVVPYYSITPPATPATTTELVIEAGFNATNNFVWTVNNSTFHADYNSPTLLQAKDGNLTFPATTNVHDFGSNSSIRFNIYNPTAASHPMHLHGHNFYVLSEGDGEWDGSIVNANNPLRRDVQTVRANGHIVIQIDADNPGVWPLHCHIAWHVSGGLYINVLERPADITNMEIPLIMPQTCDDWTTWTASNVPDEIDSGV